MYRVSKQLCSIESWMRQEGSIAMEKVGVDSVAGSGSSHEKSNSTFGMIDVYGKSRGPVGSRSPVSGLWRVYEASIGSPGGWTHFLAQRVKGEPVVSG